MGVGRGVIDPCVQGRALAVIRGGSDRTTPGVRERLATADAYRAAAFIIASESRRQLRAVKETQLLAMMFVLLAIAFEIHLKCLLLSELKETPKGRNFTQLFGKLSLQTRQRISSEWATRSPAPMLTVVFGVASPEERAAHFQNRTPEGFAEQLNRAETQLDRFRYTFEVEPKRIAGSFCEAIDAIRDLILEQQGV